MHEILTLEARIWVMKHRASYGPQVVFQRQALKFKNFARTGEIGQRMNVLHVGGPGTIYDTIYGDPRTSKATSENIWCGSEINKEKVVFGK